MYKTKSNIKPINTSPTPAEPIYVSLLPLVQNGKKLETPYAVCDIALPGNTPVTPAFSSQLFDPRWEARLCLLIKPMESIIKQPIGPIECLFDAPTESPPPIPTIGDRAELVW